MYEDESTDGGARAGASAYARWLALLGGDSTAAMLLSEPELRAAVDDDDPSAIRRALLRQRKRTRDARERTAIDGVLGNPRCFATWNVKPPGLGRLNGFGVGMYGSSDADPEDGSYVKTRYISALWIPLIALDSWIVRDAKKGWYFLGRTPLTPKLVRRNNIVVALLGLAFLVFAASSAFNAFHADVHVVNGLDIPVAVQVGEELVEVAPGAHDDVTVPTGDLSIVCRDAGGQELESLRVEMKHGYDAAIYNVLGLAPVFTETDAYHIGTPSAEKRAAELYSFAWCIDESWTPLRRLEHAFRALPEKVELKRSESVVTRTRCDVVDGGWKRACWVEFEVSGRRAAAIVAARAACAMRCRNGSGDEAYDIIWRLRAPAAARAVVDSWLAEHGSDPGVESFRAQLDEEPGDVVPEQMFLSGTEREQMLEELTREHGRTAHRMFTARVDNPDVLTRFGGRPWLANGEEWPRCPTCSSRMPLFLQLELSKLPDDYRLSGMPGALLQVFHCVSTECERPGSAEPFDERCKLVRTVLAASSLGRVAETDESPDGWRSMPFIEWKAEQDLPSMADLEPFLGDDLWRAGVTYDDDELVGDAYALSGDKLGGWPLWEGNVERPRCPTCGRELQALFQLEGHQHIPYAWGDEGVAHVWICRTDPTVVTLTWQSP